MTGTLFFPLSEQIADTTRAHGIAWAARYYAKRGVPLAEFVILARGAGLI
jgi:hypothetical protein